MSEYDNIIKYLITTYDITINDYYNKDYLISCKSCENNKELYSIFGNLSECECETSKIKVNKYNLIKLINYEILKKNNFIINNNIVINENLLNTKLSEYLLQKIN
jgi:hypothetical protein